MREWLIERIAGLLRFLAPEAAPVRIRVERDPSESSLRRF